ncbi:MAG: hypothetical protein ABL893_16170 [Hyphomicrobium sp.]|nr:hypothetical protein [Hyphomicrobium sp.]
MSLKKIITSATVAIVTAGSLVPMASAANARDYGRHSGFGGGKGHVERHGPRQHFGGGYGNQHANIWHAPRRHRDHTGRNVAIGAFAAVLGLALAAEANRTQRRYYDDRD